MASYKYKLLLIVIKYSTWILAAIYLIGSILLHFKLYNPLLSWIGFTGLIPIMLLYLCSIAFNFCIWHRLPLYYILLCNILNIFAWFGHPIFFGLVWHFIIFGFLILLGAYLKNKYNEKNRSSKKNSA